jgi:hypothetical protein
MAQEQLNQLDRHFALRHHRRGPNASRTRGFDRALPTCLGADRYEGHAIRHRVKDELKEFMLTSVRLRDEALLLFVACIAVTIAPSFRVS